MSASEQRPRADLSALKIHRNEDDYGRGGFPLGTVLMWAAILIVLGVLGYVGYTKVIVPRQAPVVESIIVKPSVNVANPALLTATGYLVADRQSKITPKISGKVVQMNVDTGKNVKKGDVLAVLESTNLQAQLDESNASLGEAEREYTRQTALWKQGVTSKSNLDSAEAQAKAARARVDQIKINMQDMVVRAPFDGTIATKNTEVGEVISSVTMGQVAGTLPAGAICTIVDLKTLQVVADVNEGSIGQLHEGQPAEVTVDAFPGEKWKGVLRQIIPTADRAKAIVQVKVAIINPSSRLLPEMSSSVSFLQSERSDSEMREQPKLWLPPGAVVDGRIAIIDSTSHVKWTSVGTGATREGRLEITSGLHEGDRVVTDKASELKNGELVRLTES